MAFPHVLIIEGDFAGCFIADQQKIGKRVNQNELTFQYEYELSLSAARERLVRQDFDCIVLVLSVFNDDELSLESFENCISTFLADLRDRNIPLIVLARSGEEERALQLMQQGATDYVIQDPEDRYLKLLPITLQKAIETAQIKKQLTDLTEQRKHETHFLQTIIDAVPAKIFIKDREGHYLVANQEIAKFYGVPLETLINNPCFISHLDQSLKDQFIRENQTVVTTGKKLVIEAEHVPDIHGETHWYQWQKIPIQLPGHSEVMVLGVGTDITQYKQTELALIQSEQRFRTTFEQAAVGICHVGLDGHFLKFNSAFCDIVGYSPEKLQTLTFQEITHPDDLPEDLQLVQRFLRGHCSTYTLEKRYVRQDRSIIWANLTVTLVRDSSGQPDYFISVIENITDRKQAEARLRQSEQRYAMLAEASPVGIFRTDQAGQCIYVNDRWSQITGLQFSQAQGTAWIQALYPDDRDKVFTEWDLAVQEDRPFQLEYRFQRSDGTITWVFGQAITEYTAEREIAGFVGTITDITKLKQTEAALQCLNQELEQRIKQRTAELQQMFAEQQNVEAQLRSLSDRLNLAVKSAQMGIWEWDITQDEVIWDDCMYQLYGLRREDFANAYEAWLSAIHPDDRQEAELISEQARRGELEYNPEFRVIHPNGSIHYIQAYALIERDATGQPQRMIGINFDITERKQAEIAIRESERLFASLTKAAPVAIFRFDTVGNCIYINDRWSEMTGRSLDQGLGRGWIETIHPEDCERISVGVAEWARTCQSGDLYQNEARILRPDGSILWYVCRMVPELNAQGTITGYVGTLTDISDRKLAELALQASEARFRNYFEQSLVGMAITSPEQGWIEVNDRLCEILGYSREELTQLTWSEMTYPEDLGADLSRFNQVLSGETNGYSMDKRFIRKDGQIIHASISVRCLRKDDGSVDYFVALIQDITARKQVEERLRESESSLSEAQRVAHIGNWVFDLPTQVIRWSEELYCMFGLDPAQPAPPYDAYLQMIHPEDRTILLECVQTAITEGSSYTLDYRVLLPNGVMRYHEGRGEAIRDHYGKVIKLYGTALDITDRKQVELELRQNRDLREAFFEKSADALFVVNPDTELIIDCNQRAIEMFEATEKSELLNICGNTLQKHPFTPEELAAIITQVKTTGTWSQEVEYVTRRGKLFWANTAGIVISVAGQEARLVRLSDITNRKKIDLLLNQQLEKEQLLVSVLSRIRDSLDLKAILQTAVDEVRELFQSDRVLVYKIQEDYTGRTVAEAIQGDWQPILNRPFPTEIFSLQDYQNYAQGTTYIINNREQLRLTNSMLQFMQEFQVQATLVVPIVQREHNRLWGLLIAHECSRPRDWEAWEVNLLQQLAGQLAIAIQQADLYQQIQTELAERQQAETVLQETNEQLQLANMDLARATRLKDEFLANMSHELRTPLNAILGMSEALEEQVFGELNAQQLKAITTIESSGKHLLDLINDILDLAKIEAGKLELSLTRYSVQALCTSSLNMVKQIAYQKNIHLSSVISPEIEPEIEMDDRRMRQVLVNLLSNAIKFTPEKGAVVLEVWSQAPGRDRASDQLQPSRSSPPHLMHFSVVDTGIGIAAQDMPKLFRSFVQIDSSLNRQYNGTGLGLALVKRIIELHGGWVQAESELGQGSRFTVVLPYRPLTAKLEQGCQPISATAAACLEPEQATTSHHPLILLAEDNPANTDTLSYYLTTHRYRVIVATNGIEVVSMAKLHQPDLILMDIQMPTMDGLEAARQIRAIPELTQTPIIALTALAMPGDRERCLEAGMNEYLTKPFQLKQLVNQISQLLRP